MTNLDPWHAHGDLDQLRAEFGSQMNKRQRKLLAKDMAKGRTRGSIQEVAKLTRIVHGQPRIISDPPLLVPVDEFLPARWTGPAFQAALRRRGQRGCVAARVTARPANSSRVRRAGRASVCDRRACHGWSRVPGNGPAAPWRVHLAKSIRTVGYTWYTAAVAGAVLIAMDVPHPTNFSGSPAGSVGRFCRGRCS